MLEGCVAADRVAAAMLQIVQPLHQDLHRLAVADQASSSRSGIYDLLENPQAGTSASAASASSSRSADLQIRAAVIPAMQTAIEVLGNPFGHPRRNEIDSDPSVPTWWN